MKKEETQKVLEELKKVIANPSVKTVRITITLKEEPKPKR